jgi:hypothetical protein
MEIVEIIPYAASFITALLGGLFSIWVAKKIMFSRDNIMESVDSVLDYAINTVEGQSKIKAVMEKLSEGFFRGTPLGKGKSGGRMNFEDTLKQFILQMGVSYAQKAGWLPTGTEQPQNQQEQSIAPWERK